MNLKYILKTFPADINRFTTIVIVFNLFIIVGKTQEAHPLFQEGGFLYEVKITSSSFLLL